MMDDEIMEIHSKKRRSGTVSRSPGKYESISFTLLTRIYWTKKTFVVKRATHTLKMNTFAVVLANERKSYNLFWCCLSFISDEEDMAISEAKNK